MKSVFVGFIALSATLIFSSCSTDTPVPGAPSALESKLIGKWILVGAAIPGSPSGIGHRVKIFTPGHWEIVQQDPSTGAVIFHHGGTFRILHGDELEQTTEFAGEATADYVHQVHYFMITMDEDAFEQIGLDSPFNEVWKRLPESTQK